MNPTGIKPAVSLEASVRQYQQGNREAFSQVYQESCKPLYVYAKYLEKDNNKAEDLLQDTYVEIMKSVGSLQHPEAFMTWSKTIMNRLHKKQFTGKGSLETTIADEEQAASLFDQIEDTDQTFMPAENIDEKALKAFVLDQINDLSDQQRLAMLLFYYDRLPIREIAGIMEVSENTVKAHLYQGRAAVKQKIEAYEEKHGIRMHSILPTPFLFWLFKDAGNTAAEAMDPDLAAQVFESLSAKAAVGAGGEAAAAGSAAAVGAASASAGISGKVIAIAVAGLLALGGAGFGVHHLTQSQNAHDTAVTTEEQTEENAPQPTEEQPTEEELAAMERAAKQDAFDEYFTDAFATAQEDDRVFYFNMIDADEDGLIDCAIHFIPQQNASDEGNLSLAVYRSGKILEKVLKVPVAYDAGPIDYSMSKDQSELAVIVEQYNEQNGSVLYNVTNYKITDTDIVEEDSASDIDKDTAEGEALQKKYLSKERVVSTTGNGVLLSSTTSAALYLNHWGIYPYAPAVSGAKDWHEAYRTYLEDCADRWEEAKLSDSGNPPAVASVDVNGDGVPELFIHEGYGTSGTDMMTCCTYVDGEVQEFPLEKVLGFLGDGHLNYDKEKGRIYFISMPSSNPMSRAIEVEIGERGFRTVSCVEIDEEYLIGTIDWSSDFDEDMFEAYNRIFNAGEKPEYQTISSRDDLDAFINNNL